MTAKERQALAEAMVDEQVWSDQRKAIWTCLAERDAAFDLLGELLKRTDVPLSRILNDARALLEGKSCPPSS